MISTVARERCWNHVAREAVARCPECARFFCRECVIEHEDRVICASCLGKLTARSEEAMRGWQLGSLIPLTGSALGLLVAWLVFYLAGRAVLEVPDDFHASKIWNASPFGSQVVRRP